ncbi:unnamed protein product [Rotaria sp. Silwood1]|nr:unnamed protein product [Rotaria sp. Silwood1]
MPFSQRYLDRKVDNKIRPVNMGGEMSLVLPHLYLGSLKDRTNSALMVKNKVKRILCVIDIPDIIVDKEEYKPTHILNIPAADAQEQDLAQYFEKCIEFIHQARIEHENILVHCQAGVSRSATIVLAYVMTIGDYDVEKALQIVKGARGYIHPNPGFLSQLKRYYTNDVKKNWYRLTRRYPSYAFDNDENFVKSSLNIYWQQFEPAFIAEPAQKKLEKKFGSPLRTEDDLHMCDDNQRAYERMINGDISLKQFSNDELNTNVIEQNMPSITEQIIDNNQEQKLKRIITINEENPSASIVIDEQQILSHDKQVEKTSVIPSTTKRYHGSKNKFTISPPPYSQSSTPRIIRSRTTPWLTFPEFRQDSTSKRSPVSNMDSFSDNLKRAALILAGIALGLGILRICLMLCKSRSPNRSLSNRHSATVRPQIATIERHQFKPDLPPAYAEAITSIDNDDGKLPSYEELPYEQQQEQQVNNNDGIISTQM